MIVRDWWRFAVLATSVKCFLSACVTSLGGAEAEAGRRSCVSRAWVPGSPRACLLVGSSLVVYVPDCRPRECFREGSVCVESVGWQFPLPVCVLLLSPSYTP